MRNRRWLRYGLGSLVVASAGLGTFLVACGDDDTTPTVTPDGGQPDTGTPDVSTPDAGPPADSGAQPEVAKLTLANAAVDLGQNADFQGTQISGVRVCFALNGQLTPLPPQPDRTTSALPPAIPIGFGGQFPSFGIPLEGFTLTPYVMNAKAMAEKGVLRQGANPGPTCSDILTPGANLDGSTFTEGVDYWKLPDFPAGTFANGKSYALVLTGCASDPANQNVVSGNCGTNWGDAGKEGNLKVTVYELDRGTTVGGSEFGAQFIHASSPAAAAGIPVKPEIDAPDASATRGAIGTEGDAGVGFGQMTAFTKLTNVNVDTDLLVVNQTLGVAQPLKGAGSIQAVSYPNGDGGAPLVPPGADYRNGAGFVFIALGDPGQPKTIANNFNGRTLHFLGFPTDPTIEKYVP